MKLVYIVLIILSSKLAFSTDCKEHSLDEARRLHFKNCDFISSAYLLKIEGEIGIFKEIVNYKGKQHEDTVFVHFVNRPDSNEINSMWLIYGFYEDNKGDTIQNYKCSLTRSLVDPICLYSELPSIEALIDHEQFIKEQEAIKEKAIKEFYEEIILLEKEFKQ